MRLTVQLGVLYWLSSLSILIISATTRSSSLASDNALVQRVNGEDNAETLLFNRLGAGDNATIPGYGDRLAR
jgi:hypothetical protein